MRSAFMRALRAMVRRVQRLLRKAESDPRPVSCWHTCAEAKNCLMRKSKRVATLSTCMAPNRMVPAMSLGRTAASANERDWPSQRSGSKRRGIGGTG